MTAEKTIVDGGIKCPNCEHKLFIVYQYLIGNMEIKCPKCKKIIKMEFMPGTIEGFGSAKE